MPTRVHRQSRFEELPFSVMARSASARVAVVGLGLALLWLAVWWAVSLP